MLPIHKEAQRTLHKATVLKLLANNDAVCYTKRLTSAKMFSTFYQVNTTNLVQADGGANRSLTNNISLLHTYWNIEPYMIGGIGACVTCTKKGPFHLKCDDGSVIRVEMFFSADYTETIILPIDIVFTTRGGKCPTVQTVTDNSDFRVLKVSTLPLFPLRYRTPCGTSNSNQT